MSLRSKVAATAQVAKEQRDHPGRWSAAKRLRNSINAKCSRCDYVDIWRVEPHHFMLQTPIANIHRHMETDKFIRANRWRRSHRPTHNGRMKRINELDETPSASRRSRSPLVDQSRQPSKCEKERVAKPSQDKGSIETYRLPFSRRPLWVRGTCETA